ncbi:hypothetical protein ABK040_009696 [Willaertia magna]
MSESDCSNNNVKKRKMEEKLTEIDEENETEQQLETLKENIILYEMIKDNNLLNNNNQLTININGNNLPNELIDIILSFSSIIDIIKTYQFINRKWRNLIKEYKLKPIYDKIYNQFCELKFDNTITNLGAVLKYKNMEKEKEYLFNYFNKNNLNNWYLYCINMEENDNHIECNDMNQLFKIFKLSNITIDHIYPKIYNYSHNYNIFSRITFVLFLDNEIPLLISSIFECNINSNTFLLIISIYDKPLFKFNQDNLIIDYYLLNTLIDEVFEIDKEELNKLIIEKNKFKSSLQSFIIGYLFYLFRVFHDDIYNNESFETNISLMVEGIYERGIIKLFCGCNDDTTNI